jgi:hypothetical protein
MSITYVTMQKEFFRFRGELQNNAITGVGLDERNACKDFLNKEMRRIAELRPPYLKGQFHLRMQKSIPLTGTTGTVTGTKGLPLLNDSSSNITQKHWYWMLTGGDHRYRVISNSGTTISLDVGTFTTATTATIFTAYKDLYPLPHNCGDIINMYLESEDTEIKCVPASSFNANNRDFSSSSTPRWYALDAFTNRFDKYKFQQTSVTFTNGSNVVAVGSTYVQFYDENDNLLVDTATTDEYLHTLISVDTTNNNIYLDRKYEGSTGSCTVNCNPRESTRYVSFFYLPDTEVDVVLNAWLRPPDLVSDTDVSPFEDDLTWAVIIGALNQDKVSRQFLTEFDLKWYEDVMDRLMHDRVFDLPPPPSAPFLGGTYTYRDNKVTWGDSIT